jgi:Na+/melibiose symporter-like transporter
VDGVVPVLLGGGAILLAGLAFALARRFGWGIGLLLPGLALAGAMIRQSMPLGHAEEAMGRGIEIFVLWLPLVVLTLVGAGLGLWLRRKARRG